MIKITIGEAIDGTMDTCEHYLYLYRDEDTIFYVGQSLSPLDRLMQHLGKEYPWQRDRVGEVITNNFPESRSWQMEMYTLRDCLEFMQESPLINFYLENIDNLLFRKKLIDDAEVRMIRLFSPCLNVLHNTIKKNRLPDKYRQKENNEIANKGVILG